MENDDTILFSEIDVKEKDRKTQTIDMNAEEMRMLTELAEHLKNSKSGAVRYAIKYCYREFCEKS